PQRVFACQSPAKAIRAGVARGSGTAGACIPPFYRTRATGRHVVRKASFLTPSVQEGVLPDTRRRELSDAGGRPRPSSPDSSGTAARGAARRPSWGGPVGRARR